MEAGQQLEAFGQAQLVHRAHLGADNAEDDVNAEPMPNDTCAEASKLRRIGKIEVAAFGQLSALCFVQETGRECRGVAGRQLGRVGPDRLENAVEPPDGLGVDPKMNIGGATLLPDRQILIDVGRGRRGGSRSFGGHAKAGATEDRRPPSARKENRLSGACRAGAFLAFLGALFGKVTNDHRLEQCHADLE